MTEFWQKGMAVLDRFFSEIDRIVLVIQDAPPDVHTAFTTVARFLFIALSLFVLGKAIASLLMNSSPAEVWGYFSVAGGDSIPITHWENAIGRSKRCDLVLSDPTVSRTHGCLNRDDQGRWKYKDLGSSNGTYVNGERLRQGDSIYIEPGDRIEIGESVCTLFPISLEERRNNLKMRRAETFLLSPWTSLIALTVFQVLTVVQLVCALGEAYSPRITMSFLGMILLMWGYAFFLRILRRRGFEMELIAFFLSTLSLAVTASKFPSGVLKQFIAVAIGLFLFFFMCTFLRNLEYSKAVRKILIGVAAAALIVNLLFGTETFGATNWITIGGLSIQPSELVKLAFIWAGAATLDELLERRNSIIFMIFSGFCFICLALMGDFGTALIFFVSFLVISFLRSGDLTKLILILGVAAVGGLMVIRFKSYIALRFSAWGHVWEQADGMGYQQTRTMAASASGGLFGLGAGNGWLKNVAASETDLVFGLVTEEWGLIIAILAIVAIITLSVFAVRSIWAGRSTFYTIAACSAMSLFLFQTMLNVFGSIDLFPLTGVTFPFVSCGGTSMVSSWGMLAFLKAADTRMNASLAVSNRNKGILTAEELLPPDEGTEPARRRAGKRRRVSSRTADYTDQLEELAREERRAEELASLRSGSTPRDLGRIREEEPSELTIEDLLEYYEQERRDRDA